VTLFVEKFRLSSEKMRTFTDEICKQVLIDQANKHKLFT
jgi:hypothetical protein